MQLYIKSDIKTIRGFLAFCVDYFGDIPLSAISAEELDKAKNIYLRRLKTND